MPSALSWPKLLALTSRRWRRVLPGAAAVTLGAAALVAGVSPAAHAAGTGPCDIYAAAGTPCVAAHSTTRALFGAYNGRLYQVRRASDGATTNINTLSAGGFANAAAQDSFCAGTTCTITIIYDQTSRGNNLTQAPAGGAAGGPDALADASALPVMAGGHKVYGVFVAPGVGYRDDATSGIATGGQAQGEYMVAAGSHVNSGCCFDYGNAETNARDNGNGHMGAVYFGKLCWFGGVVAGQCAGSGPWVMADLENGLFAGANGTNLNNTGRGTAFVTGMVKMNSTTYAIKDANADSGGLKTDYSGALPTTTGYTPLHLEGGIILGIGGDNSKGSAGSFFEGVITSGFPTDAAENAVQANITSVDYANPPAGAGLTPGANVSLRATTACCTGDYLSDQAGDVMISPVTSTSAATDKADATWTVRAGLANPSCVSFESRTIPGDFIRHQNFQLFRQANDGSTLFQNDATFCPVAGNNGQGTSFMSVNFPTRFIRHFDFTGFIASDGGTNTFDSANLWPDDTTWVVSAPWSP
jgi:non-reducing end alpha-L-arabinofuranosidase